VQHQARVSGSVPDRIDLQIAVPALTEALQYLAYEAGRFAGRRATAPIDGPGGGTDPCPRRGQV
jgi:hypothetical protein